MALIPVLIYIALNILSPVDMFPALAPYRVMLILLAVAAPLSVIRLVVNPTLIFSVRKELVLMTLLMVFITLSWIPHKWFGGTLTAFEGILPSLTVYYMLVGQVNSVRHLQVLRFTLVGVALFVLFNGLSEISTVQATGQHTPYVYGGLLSTGTTMIRIRGLGIMHDPNEFGQFLLILMPLLFVDTNPDGDKPAVHFIAIPVTILLLVGVFYTNSRGTQIGLALLISHILYLRYKLIGGVASAFVGGVMVILVNTFRERTIAISGGLDRLTLWGDGLTYFKSSPLWGIGYYGFVNRNRQTAHNTFVLAFSELGIMGYFLWMSLIVVTILLLRQVSATKATPFVLVRWANALRSSLFVFLGTSFFLSRTYSMPLYLLLGTSAAVIAMAGGEDAFKLNRNWPIWALAFCLGSIAVVYMFVRLRVLG